MKFCFSFISIVFFCFQGQSAKKMCLQFATFNFSEKLQNIFEIRLKKIWSHSTKLGLKKVFTNKKFADMFLFDIC